jgi:hypothetical protein
MAIGTQNKPVVLNRVDVLPERWLVPETPRNRRLRSILRGLVSEVPIRKR